MFGIPTPYTIAAALAGAALICVAAFYEGWHEKSLRDAAVLTAAEANVIIQNHAADIITADTVQAAAISQLQIATMTQTQVMEVTTYVTDQADTRCTVPVGFVRLHDAAAAGVPVTPNSAGQSNDAASGVELSAVARTVAGNYGQCRAIADQLTRLQDWITQETASRAKFTPAP